MQLNVLIVGDGLDALITAVALQKHGHVVQLFAKDIHSHDGSDDFTQITPNAHDALERLGISLPQDIATPVDGITELSPSKEIVSQLSMVGQGDVWLRPWLLVQESRFRKILMAHLSAETEHVAKVEIHQDEVRSVETETATVAMSDGTQIKGDILVGADGAHSIVRSQFEDGIDGATEFKLRIIQARIEKETFHRYIDTRELLAGSQQIVVLSHGGARIAAVPKPHSASYDVVSFWPEVEAVRSGPQPGNDFKNILETAGPEISRQELPQNTPLFSQGSVPCALVGEAASSRVPFLGLDVGQAVEDAAALVVVLSDVTSKGEIPDRLRLYSDIRHDRALEMQSFSYNVAAGLTGADVNVSSQLHEVFSHNEYDYSVQRLRQFRWSLKPNLYWRMPIEFGPLPGPRQGHDGSPFTAQHSSFVSASIRFKTERSLLENLLPPFRKGFRFRDPGSVAYASFMQHTFSNLDWLGGGGYRLLGFYIHGVEYVSPQGKVLRGTHIPVLFESLTDPILSGREELGMPKLYCSIDAHKRTESLRVNASWEGAVWGNFAWTGLEEIEVPKGPPAAGPAEDGALCYKYIPRVGRQSDEPADADYPILIPGVDESCKPNIKRIWKAKDATIRLDKMDWEALPTMHHIVARLQELPVLEVVDARVVEGEGVSSAPLTRVIQ